MKMRKSKCVYCVKGIDLGFGECGPKVTVCNLCDIDEWDETVRCKEGWCPHYKRRNES